MISRTKIVNVDQLSGIRERYLEKKIVHCHGVYDLLHYGHLTHLNAARKLGDILVVSITADKYVNKGPGRPYYDRYKRAEFLASIAITDYVCINDKPTSTNIIELLRPDFYAKGTDYKDTSQDITGGIIAEKKIVERCGGQVVFTDTEIYSSTSIINTYFNRWNNIQDYTINLIKNKYGLTKLLAIISKLASKRVVVLGEPIIDKYIFCQPENLSSKSPSISAQYIHEETYAGGSLAIARNLSALGCDVTLLLPHGSENEFLSLLNDYSNHNNSIEIISLEISGSTTPKKTRFVTQFNNQRVFELIDLDTTSLVESDIGQRIGELSLLTSKLDAVVLCDFGHGLFEGQVLDKLNKVKSFIGLNVQTNSGNYGFNPFHKHQRYDYLSIDEREARLGQHDRLSCLNEVVDNVFNRIRQPLSVTMGVSGSIYYDNTGEQFQCPTYFKETVDTTGAGDAYFAITTLLVAMGVEIEIIPFLGNLYAGLNAQIIGNKCSVNNVDLIRTVKAILG